MAWNGYSTVQQVRNNVAKAQKIADISNVHIQDRITEADRLIKSKLSKVVDFSLVPADSETAGFPDYINTLSQYKAAELTLVRMFGAKRRVQDITDITYWKESYEELLGEIMAGDIDVGAFAGTTDTLQVGKEGIRPALGLGDHGAFVSDDTLEDDRPTGQDSDDSYLDEDGVV